MPPPVPDKPDYIRAHVNSANHRLAIEASAICGCFYCLETFSPRAITEWTDDVAGMGTTALCPHCGIDSVIASESGYPITRGFLGRMRSHWFNSA
jgi:hypothetical protein